MPNEFWTENTEKMGKEPRQPKNPTTEMPSEFWIKFFKKMDEKISKKSYN